MVVYLQSIFLVFGAFFIGRRAYMRYLKLPLGMSDFEEIRQNGYYYIDKSGLISDLLVRKAAKVTLITRPRRFGKTLGMSMLAHFFDIEKDSRALFEGLEISRQKELCVQWMNQYPVIFLTFKKVDGLNFKSAYEMLEVTIAEFCQRHSFLMESEKIAKEQKEVFQRLKECRASGTELKNSLEFLARMMQIHYGKQVILLLDEYDVPIAKASSNGYYKEMLEVMKAMLGSSLKDNPSVKFAVITGCLKVAKESIFTGTNNFVSDSILSFGFSEYFGFTQKETEKLLLDADAAEYAPAVRKWYDGYHFGNVDVYCPWDVINHVDRIKDDPMAGPEAYWINTSGNELVKRFIDKAGKTTRDEIERLIAGEAIDKQIRLDMTYDEIDNNIDNLWSVLFTTGYLTYTKISENKKYSLVIPNNEIKEVFKLQIQEWFRNKIFSNTEQLQDFWKAFKDGNTQIMEMYLNKVLSNSVSVFDTRARNDEKESSYHNLLIGILSGNEDWLVKSNVEAGEGFADIIVETDDPDEGIIAELKYTKDFKAMEKSCEKALKQIKDRRYQEYLLNDDRQNIMYYGITFCRKRCKVLVER